MSPEQEDSRVAFGVAPGAPGIVEGVDECSVASLQDAQPVGLQRPLKAKGQVEVEGGRHPNSP
jgi:hypothetical protein